MNHLRAFHRLSPRFPLRTSLGYVLPHKLSSACRSLSIPVQQDTDEFGDFDVQDSGIYDVILPSEPHVFGTSHIKPRPVPPSILRPPYIQERSEEGAPYPPERYLGDGRIELGSEEEEKLRAAARLAKRTVDFAGSLVKVRLPLVMDDPANSRPVQPGVTTGEIDAAVHNFIVSHFAYPSPLLYNGFPKSCCTSVNNVITHGIPDEFVSHVPTRFHVLKVAACSRMETAISSQSTITRWRHLKHRHNCIFRWLSWRYVSYVHGGGSRKSQIAPSARRCDLMPPAL